MPIYRFAPFFFDVSTRILSLEDGSDGAEQRELRFKTAQLLLCFLERPNHLWSKSELLEKVWDDVVVGEAVVFQTLSELRKELTFGSSEPMIETVKGKGYRWVGAAPQKVDPQATTPAEDDSAEKTLELTTALKGTSTQQLSWIRRTATRRTAFLILILVVPAVAGLTFGAWLWNTDESPPSPAAKDTTSDPRILLLSDRSPSDPNWMGETRRGLLVMINTLLGSASGVETVTLDASDQWIFKSAEDLRTKARAASHLAELLGVRYVVFTELRSLDGDAYRLSFSLYSGERRLESATIEESSLLSGAESLAAEISAAIGLPAPTRKIHLSFSNDGRALNAFHEGQEAFERGDMVIAAGWLEKALAIDPEFPWAQLTLARIREAQGEVEAGASLLQQALTGARASDDYYLQIECLGLLAKEALRSGDTEALLDYQRQFQKAAWRWGDRRAEASALRMLGSYHLQLKDYQEAETSYRASLKIAETAGDRVAEAHAVNNLGAVALHREDYPAARDFFSRAVEAYEAVGNSWFQVGPLANLGMTARHLGEPQAAESYLQRALTLSRKNGNPAYSSRILASLGLLRSNEGQKEKAAQTMEEALALMHEIQDEAGAANVAFNLAQVYLDLRRHEPVPELLTFCEGQWGRQEPHVFVLWAEYYDRVDEPRKALERMRHAQSATGDQWSEEHQRRLELYLKKSGRAAS